MSVISHHSCLVFSHPFAKPNTKKRQQTFIKYSTVVWLGPAFFVAICIVLDKTGKFVVNYGTNCRLGTRNSTLYLFLLAIGLLLLFYFVKTPEWLGHFTDKENEKSPDFYKTFDTGGLSLDISFLWRVFSRRTSIRVSVCDFLLLQGFYIGMTFLCNTKIFALYQNSWV